MFAIPSMLVAGRPSQLNLMFLLKVKSLPMRGAPEKGLTR